MCGDNKMYSPRDNNFIPAKMGIWCGDGITPIPIAVDLTTGAMKTDTVSVILYNPVNIAPRDENHMPVWLGQSTVDGTVLPINVNSDGAVLVDL